MRDKHPLAHVSAIGLRARLCEARPDPYCSSCCNVCCCHGFFSSLPRRAARRRSPGWRDHPRTNHALGQRLEPQFLRRVLQKLGGSIHSAGARNHVRLLRDQRPLPDLLPCRRLPSLPQDEQSAVSKKFFVQSVSRWAACAVQSASQRLAHGVH